MNRDPDGTIVLSRRNLLALLHKLDMAGSACTLYRRLADGSTLVVRAEDDPQHYAGRAVPPGPMHHETEAFIAQHGWRPFPDGD